MDADQRHFYLRRLHSLTGIIPVGAFLIQHIYGNFLSMWGEETYNEHVRFLISQPLLYVLEFGIIFAPLAFHALLGMWFMMESKWNPGKYPYARNWLYTLQRVTAMITLVYVVFHVVQTRFSFSDAQKWEMYSSMQNLFAHNPHWLAIVYIIGVTAAAFHLCNGMVTACIVWGITITREAQRRVFAGAMLLFAALTIMGVLAVAPLAGWIDPLFHTAKDEHSQTHDDSSTPYQGETPYSGD